jgi:hypothetical protein
MTLKKSPAILVQLMETGIGWAQTTELWTVKFAETWDGVGSGLFSWMT